MRERKKDKKRPYRTTQCNKMLSELERSEVRHRGDGIDSERYPSLARAACRPHKRCRLLYRPRCRLSEAYATHHRILHRRRRRPRYFAGWSGREWSPWKYASTRKSSPPTAIAASNAISSKLRVYPISLS